MSPEDYQRRMADLGVERGAFGSHFPVSDRPHGNPAVGREKPLLNGSVSKRLRAATLGLAAEDLTHLNPRRFPQRKKPE